ncbi:hypothetical protein L0152_00070 [bacterium]|nr:hypothetical protein [bacterium]
MRYLKIMFVVLAVLISGYLIAQDQDVIIQRDVIQNGQGDADATFEMPAPPPGSFFFISSLMETGDKVVKGAPYSAEAVTERLQILSDGNRISHKNTSPVFRDADGRVRREQTFGMIGNWVSADRPEKTIFIKDPVSGTHYILDSENQTATKMKLENGEPGKGVRFDGPGNVEDEDVFVAPVPGPAFKHTMRYKNNPENTKTESLGKQTMEGVDVEGSRRITTIPEGEIGNERPIEMTTEKWYSPELKVYVMTKHTDPRFGETTYRLTNIRRGDPDPSLFQVPAGYKVTESDSPRIKIRKKIEN